MTQQSTPFDPRATREHRELGFKIVNCPVCGKETLNDYYICPTWLGIRRHHKGK